VAHHTAAPSTERDAGSNTALLTATAHIAAEYLDSVGTRSVAPLPDAVARLGELDEPLGDAGADPLSVLQRLHEVASPATVASAGPRYFGFVTGGTLPAALAANWLAGAWDQNAAFSVMSPAAAAIEAVAMRWLLDVLRLPSDSAAAFVTGATMANLTGLAAARHALLERSGWNVEARGLFGAPPITVVVGDEVHVSVLKALSILGLGHTRVVRVPTDAQGRVRADAMPRFDGPTICCLQAGNVNTGAFDPARDVIAAAHDAGAWVHVDGAFGLWAAAAPAQAHLLDGFADADSWAMDAHKWLNVPYDSGVAFCRDPRHLHGALAMDAPYLVQGTGREPAHYTPEFSRRARGVEIWAALASLGRSGLAELIEDNCRLAARFADRLQAHGFEILNDVVLNQVLVSFGDDARTRAVIDRVQRDGTSWCGGTTWHGRAAMRISVSSWATTAEDVDRSVAAMVTAATSLSHL
jgi:glutamate/tyrosine decarboxylase-like PLP-dependent enzyme